MGKKLYAHRPTLGPRGVKTGNNGASRALCDEAYHRAFQQMQKVGESHPPQDHPAGQWQALLSAARPDESQVDVDGFLHSFTSG